MDKKQKWIVLAAVGIAAIFCAITAVTANSSRVSHTPLNSMRMEQQSSEMSFLPTAVNGFAYDTQGTHNITKEVQGCYNAVPLITGGAFTCESCNICIPTDCSTCWTCVGTCSTCVSTCSNTCVGTCSTCVSTCSNTCVGTCSTCVGTCSSTCMSTCSTCVNTCPETCAATCP